MADPLAITIRPLQERELEAVAQALPFGVPGKHRVRLARQRAGTALYLIAWQQTLPVGHALLSFTRPRDDPRGLNLPRCPDVEDLLVHPDWRRRGIGTQLLLAAEAAARARGYSQVGLSVALDNLEAQRMYARYGYRDAGVGLFTLVGCYQEADGTLREWSETCTYLIKRLEDR